MIITDDERFQYVMKLEQDIFFAVEKNDLSKIKYILFKDDSSLVSRNFKEKMSFLNACTQFDKGKEEVIKYLIFDYKINKENANNPVVNKNTKIQEMFAIRDLNEQLISELNNNPKPNMVIKI
jgi:hypothetical protein